MANADWIENVKAEILSEANRLRDKGHDVKIVSRRTLVIYQPTFQQKSKDIIKRWMLRTKSQLLALPVLGATILFLKWQRRNLQTLKREGLREILQLSLPATLRAYWQFACASLASDSEAFAASIYVRFEDRYRGSFAELKEQFCSYLHFLPDQLQSRPFLDIGCGRGEWVDLLRARGFRAIGADSNDAMVRYNMAEDRPVLFADAIQLLKQVKSESLGGISAFQVIEHMPFVVWVELIRQAYRCLVPGGLLILEVPHASNLLVGASNFYIDPTHVRPVHPLTLQFYLEEIGFRGHRLKYSNPVRLECIDAKEDGDLGFQIANLVFGYQDFAIVSHKPIPTAPS